MFSVRIINVSKLKCRVKKKFREPGKTSSKTIEVKILENLEL